MFETTIAQIKRKDKYEVIQKWVAGLVLTGNEIKSVREKKISLNGSYIEPINKELFVINMEIRPYAKAPEFSRRKHQTNRNKKLLLKKAEARKIIALAKAKNYLIVPLTIGIKDGWAKLEIATAKHLKKYQLKEKKKEKEIENRIKRREWESL